MMTASAVGGTSGGSISRSSERPQVAREQQAPAADLEQQAGCAQDMSGRLGPGLPAGQGA